MKDQKRQKNPPYRKSKGKLRTKRGPRNYSFFLSAELPNENQEIFREGRGKSKEGGKKEKDIVEIYKGECCGDKITVCDTEIFTPGQLGILRIEEIPTDLAGQV